MTPAFPPFVPHRWYASPHLQTVGAVLQRSGTGEHGESVRIPLDAGSLGAHLHRAPGVGAKACVVVVHGIGGSAHEPFVVRTSRGAAARGLDALRVHLRGAGESTGPEYVPLFHSGLTGDIRATVAWALARYERVHLVGFSLGGQFVLRTAGEWGASAPAGLRSVTSLSAPLDLAESAAFSERPEASLYRLAIVRTLRHRFEVARRHLGPEWQRLSLAGVGTIREFDSAVVARVFGFRDVDDYYAKASCGAVLDRIATPTLLVHAEDDPLVPAATLRRLVTPALTSLTPLVVAQGGHVGFFAAAAAPGDRTRFWAEERALQWVLAHEPRVRLSVVG